MPAACAIDNSNSKSSCLFSKEQHCHVGVFIDAAVAAEGTMHLHFKFHQIHGWSIDEQ
jgi:hypothetical protein